MINRRHYFNRWFIEPDRVQSGGLYSLVSSGGISLHRIPHWRCESRRDFKNQVMIIYPILIGVIIGLVIGNLMWEE